MDAAYSGGFSPFGDTKTGVDAEWDDITDALDLTSFSLEETYV